ncbi:MAG: MBL fold metallo-hydrolase [Caldilineae bacterium]|nr:MAG: MBL fold metallo-hydrolase [Caldilineae bacterium]
MELQFWGAARVVTGSMHLLSVNGRKLLLDCGLYQGRRKIAFEINRTLPFDASEIDALVLSHAHIDHSGNIPSLVKNGFRGVIWCTRATKDLLQYMLRDSAHIQESDVRYVNKKRRRQGKKPFEPLYTDDDAVRALSLMEGVDYHTPFSPIPGVEAFFRDAGHMLGSANVTLDIDDGGRHKRLAFSGDIGRKHLPILRDPEYVSDADYIIMESTYGNRVHAPIENAAADLKEQVLKTFDRSGIIIIPSFAVGRTQEIVYALHQLHEADEIPQLDIFVDSPLAVNVTEAFRTHPEVYDEEIKAFMENEHVKNPFGFEDLQYIRDVEDSKKLNTRREPAIIISASGMCEAGRILHHLKNHIGDPRNTVLFVGYQGEHTLGRKILEGQSPVPILGDHYEVRAEVHKLDGYSGHADRNGLLNWLEQASKTKSPRRVFLVHGEPDNMFPLAEAIEKRGLRVEVPERGQVFEV